MNNEELIIKDFKDIQNSRKSKAEVYTSIEDAKVIFNLNNKCDYKLNDCVDEVLRVKDVLIKILETDEEGVSEFKKITILIDDAGKSYVTASKMFANQFMDYIEMFGFETLKTSGLEIKIIKRSVKNSSNKALGFELV